ncbi:MAG: zinc ribbon domain-containing protein [Chitinispirillaceae bacterium]|nr:zinc ribbon domain-containing protein [Chitinispirillaceae bacterium]
MSNSQAVSPRCRSCGMPMSEPAQFGTNADGSGKREYRCCCFRKGDFTVKLDKAAFIERQVKIAVEKMGMKVEQARAMANSVIPTLNRWRS